MQCRVCNRVPINPAKCEISDQSQNPHPSCPLFKSISQMIEELDELPDMSDGIDPRTWREVYDAGIVNDRDVRQAFHTRIM